MNTRRFNMVVGACLAVLLSIGVSGAVAQQIYFTKPAGIIDRVDLDGSNREAFLSDASFYGDLAIDSQNLKIYYRYFFNLPGPNDIRDIRRAGLRLADKRRCTGSSGPSFWSPSWLPG